MSHLADYRHPKPVRRSLASLAAVVCPPEATELDLVGAIVDEVELSMRASPAGVRAALLAGIAGYELAATLVPRHRGRPASRLSPELARRYFASWWHSPLPPQRQFARGVKGLLCLACYEMPAIKEQLGYTPEAWIETVKARRLAVFADAIRRREADILAPDPLPGCAGAARPLEEVG